MKALDCVPAAWFMLLVACGGSAPPPAQPAPPAAMAGSAAAHEHEFPPEVGAFHDLMAPRWHAPAGDARQADTCGAVASFKDAAAKIGAAAVPAKAAAQEGSWHNGVADLNIALGGLESACAAAGRPSFDAAFQEVHDAFHRLVAFIGHEEPMSEQH